MIAEAGGTLGTVCIYQASGPEAVREHAGRVEMPADEIFEVADTVVIRPDPSPEGASRPGLLREWPGGNGGAPVRRGPTRSSTAPPLVDYNVFETDTAAGRGGAREGAEWAEERISAVGELAGSARAHRARRAPPTRTRRS